MLISAKNLKKDSVITNILGCVAPQDQGVKTKLQNVYFCFVGSRSARNYRFIAALTLALVSHWSGLWFLVCLQSGALSLVQIPPDTLISFVEPFLCHKDTSKGTKCS